MGLFGTSCIDVGVPAPNGVEDDGSQAGVDEEISPGAGIGVLPPNASDVPAPNGVEDDGSQAGVDEEISPGAGIGVLPPDASESMPCKDLKDMGTLNLL